MTKEELKQEAEEYYEDETEGTFQICEDCYWFSDAVQTAYVDSAEPREKQIQIDAEHIRTLQKQNGELTDKVRELEAQVEKMKNCSNCEYTPPFDKHCDNCIQGEFRLRFINWKLRR